MIDIKDLTIADVGRWVVYTGNAGEIERGKIKSWNNSTIFVVYNANGNWDLNHWKDYTGASTNPSDLDWSK